MLITRRVGSKAAFETLDAGDPSSITRAAKHVEGENLSIYEVDDPAEAVRVMLLHAATNVPNPDKVDYLIFSKADMLRSGYCVTKSATAKLHSYLRERHSEITNCAELGGSEAIVKTLLQIGCRSDRIAFFDAKNQIRIMSAADAELVQKMQPKWALAIR